MIGSLTYSVGSCWLLLDWVWLRGARAATGINWADGSSSGQQLGEAHSSDHLAFPHDWTSPINEYFHSKTVRRKHKSWDFITFWFVLSSVRRKLDGSLALTVWFNCFLRAVQNLSVSYTNTRDRRGLWKVWRANGFSQWWQWCWIIIINGLGRLQLSR